MKIARYWCVPCLLGLGALLSCGALPAPSTRLEITEVDLLELKGWSSVNVSVLGLNLGMNNEEVLALARRRNLKVLNNTTDTTCLKGPRNPNVGKVCHILTNSGLPTGVTVFYDDKDSIEIIEISVHAPPFPPSDYPPGWFKEDIRNRLQGRTAQLANHYSDDLRKELLGPEDTVEEKLLTLSQLRRSYRYRKLGLLLHVDFWGGRIPNAVPELASIEFVAPSVSENQR